MLNPAIRINGALPGVPVAVASGTTITATLDSIAGVKSCAWDVVSTDDSVTPGSYTLVESGLHNSTVTLTALKPGTSGDLRALVNDGNRSYFATCRFSVPTAGGLHAFSGGDVIGDPALAAANSIVRAAVASAMAFGAVGDGTTDDTAAINAAITAIGAGGTLVLPRGIYKTTASLLVAVANFTIRGEGPTSIIRTATAGFHAIKPTADGFKLESLRIEGAATTNAATAPLSVGQFGIFTTAGASNHVRIRRVEFGGPNATTGLNNGLKCDTCDDWIIDDVLFERMIGNDGSSWGAGYGALFGDAANFKVRRWQFKGNQGVSPVQGRHCVYVSGACSNFEISDGIGDATAEDMIPLNCYAGQGTIANGLIARNVLSNKAVGSTDSADITLNGCATKIRIIGNRSLSTGRDSILVNDGAFGGRAYDVEISGNESRDAGRSAINVQGGSRIYSLANNSAIDCSRSSIGTYAALSISSQGSGQFTRAPEDIEVQITTRTQRQWSIGELTIATPPTFVTWGNENRITGVAITNGTTITVTTYSAHGYSTGDAVAITGVLGIPQINGRMVIASTPTSTTFTVTFGSSGSGTYTASTGVVRGPSAHGLSTDDPVITSGILSSATGVAGHFLASVIDAKTIALDTSHGVASVGGGSNSLTVTGATNASPIVLTTATHGLSSGMRVLVSGVGGNLGANGEFTVTVVNATTFQLDGSVGSGAWTSGGTVKSIGLVQAPTHRGQIYVNTTGPVPRNIRIAHGTGGVPGYGASIPTTIQDNGVPIGAAGPLYAQAPQSGALTMPVATRGDLNFGSTFTVYSSSPIKDSPGSRGLNRIAYQEPGTEKLYISESGSSGGVVLAQSSSGFVSVQFGASTAFRFLSTVTQSNLPLAQTGAVTIAGSLATTRTIATPAATVTLDFGSSNVQQLTLGQNTTINATGYVDGQEVVVILVQDATGSRLGTFGSSFKFAGGTAPTLSTGANKRDVLRGVSDGTAIYITSTTLDVR